MRLAGSEIDALQATIGKPVFRLFCPSPSIFFGHLEAPSYSVWLESKADFVNIFSLEMGTYELRIAAERCTAPRDIGYERGMLKECSGIFQKERGPSTIRRIEIYERYGRDSALVFEFDEGGGSFGLFAGDACDEVCFLWDAGRAKEGHTFRAILD